MSGRADVEMAVINRLTFLVRPHDQQVAVGKTSDRRRDRRMDQKLGG